MNKKTTLSDIGRDVGVDKSTVSLVLNRKPLAARIRADVRRRIFKSAKKLNYRPSFLARALFSGKTTTLGLLVGGIDSPFYAELANIALEIANSYGYCMLTSITAWDFERERAAFRVLMERQTDGIICVVGGFCPHGEHHELYTLLKKQHYPVVLLDYQAAGFSSVSSDYSVGMDEAVSLLAGKGHGKIGYLLRQIQWNEKESAFLSACRKYKIKAVKYMLKDEPDAIKKKLVEILGHAHPKAFLVFDDSSAMEMISALKDCNKFVPGDFDIIGIDGIAFGEMYRPRLTTIQQDSKKLMNSALSLLIEMVENPNWTCKNISVPTRLIVRETVK
jgi:LacI family transcriptional regulator